MYDDNNVFAKILRNEIPCNKVYEDDHSLFFHDINPQAKIHILGIPKTKCVDFLDFISNSNTKNVSIFFNNVNIVVDKLNVRESGFRIISNSGIDGGQEVFHFHIHILAGEKIGAFK